jgi:hypothetical protein
VPMQHGAYRQTPFGPFPPPPSEHDQPDDPIARAGGVPVDIRGASDWIGILRVDCATYQWGQLVISAEASAQIPVTADTEAGITWLELDRYPWAEIRVLVSIGGIDQVWFQGGAGNHSEDTVGGNDKSPGPIILPFLLGEVPDSIQVQARAMRGGLPETILGNTEILTVTAVSRFRR